MGNWHISIEGTGIHHNGRWDDAEQMADSFVRLLKAAGHGITKANVTYGGVVDLHANQLMAIKTPKPEGRAPKPAERIRPASKERFSSKAPEHYAVLLGDASWWNGPGWYFYDLEYPDEGSFGPFESEEAAIAHIQAEEPAD